MKDPFDLPSDIAILQQFEPQRVDYAAPEAGGRVAGVQAGFPLWVGVWTLTGMTGTKSDELRAWMLKIRGATRRFLGCDQQRPYPKAHSAGFGGMTRAGGGSFDGTATSWSELINADGDSAVTLNGLPVGLVLGQGDYIGFEYDATETAIAGVPWSALVRVIVGATANGSGVAVVTCEPPIPSAVPGSATATLANPKCVMVLIGDQSSLNGINGIASLQGGQITGVQDIRS